MSGEEKEEEVVVVDVTDESGWVSLSERKVRKADWSFLGKEVVANEARSCGVKVGIWLRKSKLMNCLQWDLKRVSVKERAEPLVTKMCCCSCLI